jgi:iron(III) transport system ATP-binding protein
MFLNIEKLSFSYGHHEVIKELSLSLNIGDILAIQGPSGSGKTTLFKLISGLETPHTGAIHIDSNCVVSIDGHCIRPEKRQVGFIFQDYALFPHMTVFQNIAFGCVKMPKPLLKPYVMSLLREIELEAYKDAYPHTLSGGQMQRVAIARALASRPKVLLMDEPFSNLDESLKDVLIPSLKILFKKHQLTVIIASHHQRDIDLLATKVLHLENGSLVDKKG